MSDFWFNEGGSIMLCNSYQSSPSWEVAYSYKERDLFIITYKYKIPHYATYYLMCSRSAIIVIVKHPTILHANWIPFFDMENWSSFNRSLFVDIMTFDSKWYYFKGDIAHKGDFYMDQGVKIKCFLIEKLWILFVWKNVIRRGHHNWKYRRDNNFTKLDQCNIFKPY